MRVLTIFLLAIFLFTSMPAFGQPSDDEIYDQVRRKLANDPDVKGGALGVEVKEGVVTLTGAVEKEKAREKAERLTKKVKGVKGVVNQLVVKPRSA